MISKEGLKRRTTVETREKSHQPRKRLHSLTVTNTKIDNKSVSNHPSLKSTLKRPEREHANVDVAHQVASSSKDNKREFSRILCNLLKQQSAPDMDTKIYRRDYMKYHYFAPTFKEAVE